MRIPEADQQHSLRFTSMADAIAHPGAYIPAYRYSSQPVYSRLQTDEVSSRRSRGQERVLVELPHSTHPYSKFGESEVPREIPRSLGYAHNEYPPIRTPFDSSSPRSYPTYADTSHQPRSYEKPWKRRKTYPRKATYTEVSDSRQRCTRCGISDTPEWRRGFDGKKTLCNACGLHYSSILRKEKYFVPRRDTNVPFDVTSVLNDAESEVAVENCVGFADSWHWVTPVPRNGSTTKDEDTPKEDKKSTGFNENEKPSKEMGDKASSPSEKF